jgi:ribonucleoside-triphosphate reductase
MEVHMAQEKQSSTVADIGTVKIADDVVAMIAAFAALDVEGVACMPGDVTREEISKGVQTIQYQVVTLLTTNGQAPFVTVFMYLGEARSEQEKKEFKLQTRPKTRCA